MGFMAVISGATKHRLDVEPWTSKRGFLPGSGLAGGLAPWRRVLAWHFCRHQGAGENLEKMGCVKHGIYFSVCMCEKKVKKGNYNGL